MAGKRTVYKTNRQKEILKAFEHVCGYGRHGRGKAWADVMAMCAISLANAVDVIHSEAREKAYLSISSKYSPQEMHAAGEFFNLIIQELEENPDQDLLGELYMSLDLGRERAGQFFTPYHVSRMMAKMQLPKQMLQDQEWISVSDPCCGAGGMLVAFANECLEQGINYQTSVLFVGQDIDFTAACMCYVQLSLLGCAGYIVVGNTLTEPSTSLDERGLIPIPADNVWILPMYCSMEWSKRVFGEMMKIQKKEIM